MIAEQIMHKEVFTLRPTNTVREALDFMYEKNIRHVPIVTEDYELIGLISQYDIREKMPAHYITDKETFFRETFIEQVMVQEVITAHPLDFVEDIAQTMYERKRSCLPVVTAGKLVGIITNRDLLRSFMILTGATTPGSKFDIRVENRPGLVYGITDVFKAQKANVISVLVYPDKDSTNHSIVSVKVRVLNPTSLIDALRAENFEVLWPHMPGMTL